MPRKSRRKSTPTEPTSVAAVLEQLPVAEILASHEAQTESERPEPEQRHEEKLPPERPSLPDTDPDLPIQPSPNGKPHDGEEAVAAFMRQRERELAVDPLPERGELPPPVREVIPNEERRVKSWGETVRSWTNHGETGVRHVSTTSPDMVGLAFPKDRPRTDEEKREMGAAGLRFFKDAQAWLKTNRDDAFDETNDMSRRFAQRRRERAEEIER